jgi:S1-C subfamily serine protease
MVASLAVLAAIAATGAASVQGCQGMGATDGPPPFRVAAIARQVSPALVDIDDSNGSATGIVLSSNGLILTCAHVVYHHHDMIAVRDVGTGLVDTATVVGIDPKHDVAVLRLGLVVRTVNGWGVGVRRPSRLPTAVLGSSATLRIGQRVVAIGNAGGKDAAVPTATGGVIDFLDQSIDASTANFSAHYSDVIETDASAPGGDSGGALVNTSGQVVGILAARATFGDGYAIPIGEAMAIVRLLDH